MNFMFLSEKTKNMRTKIIVFLKYSKSYGFLNAFALAIFKLFPKKFALVAMQFKNGGGGAEIAATVNSLETLSNIMDYKSWSEYGGKLSGVSGSAKNSDAFVWFVPDWSNVWGGGHYTLFRFAQHFSKVSKSRQIIFIYNNQRHSSPEELQKTLDGAFSGCNLEVVVDPKELSFCKAAFATTWQSAYQVKAFPFAEKKFYFMQDYESLFYAFGTASMQANATYAFGFTGITGGGWLKSIYLSYGGCAQNYRFAADKDIFYPAESNARVRSQVSRVFFYGRPSTERRCFELGMASLKKISEEFPAVEIVIAGLNLVCPPPFPATLLGNLSLKETGQLYRSCDIGIAFSGTNLSYLPVELMACGVPVITNRGPQTEWHCKHNENAYIVDPVPYDVLGAFRDLVNDMELRQKLASGGVNSMANISWENEMDKVYEYIVENLS